MGMPARPPRNGRKTATAGVNPAGRDVRAEKLAAALAAHKEAVEQQAATAEILRAMSRSSKDAQPVFEAIVESTRRLFHTSYAVVSLKRGESLEMAAASGDDKYLKKVRAAYPWPLKGEGNGLAARAVRTGKVVHLCPIAGDREVPAKVRQLAKDVGYDAILMAPLMREGTAIGLIVTARKEAVA